MTNYLRRFWTIFKDYFHEPSDLGMPDLIDPEELVARYLTSSKYFSRERKAVKSVAFLPRDDNLQLSVFRTEGLTEAEIWKIGEENVARLTHRNLHGRGDITASIVQAQGLHIDPDDSPRRHANIIWWPEDKPKRLEIAQELAASATLILRS